MSNVNQTRSHCVNQMGKTNSKPLAARHGRRTAWAQHAMCELDFMDVDLCNQNHSPALFHALHRRHRQACLRLAQSLCGMASLNTVPGRSVVAKSDRVCIDAPVSISKTIYKYVEMFRATGSVLGSKRTHRRHVLTEEKLGKMDDSLNMSTN